MNASARSPFLAARPRVPDPAELTAAEKSALAMMAVQPLFRTRDGWSRPGHKRVSLKLAGRLGAMRLIRQQTARGKLTIELSATGRMVLDIIAERKRG